MTRLILGMIVVGLLTGCAYVVAGKPMQQDCERQGGRWIAALQQCEIQAGGGGAGD